MINSGLMSSNSDCWETPQELFDELNQKYNFDVDVCALPKNAKCANYFTPEIDGLKQEWIGTCWMNPPYGHEIGKWMQKAYKSSLAGATVVCLVPARTDTAWWHDYAMKGKIEFIRGRLKFGNSKTLRHFRAQLLCLARGAMSSTLLIVCLIPLGISAILFIATLIDELNRENERCGRRWK